MENKHKKYSLDEPDTCSTNSSCATSIDSNIDSCTTGTTSQSSVESSSPNPLRSSIEEDDEEDDQHQRSIPPPPEFGHDDDSCPVSSSSSSSLSDAELLDNELGEVGPSSSTTTTTTTIATTTTTTTTGQFLWIDHHPRRHSFANDSHLIDGNNFHYHPSSPFLDHQSSIEDLRARFASAYILTTPSLTELEKENDLSLQHETSINDGSIDLNEDTCSATSWAISFEKLLNDEIGLYVFTEFLKKEFSQENIQFWIECENFKKLTNQDEIRQKANSIWSTYLHDTDDGSCRINIDSRTRHECQQSLLNKPHAYLFEKAQSQIFQLMKLDSYARFLKSNMYKDCIMSEMEGKSIPYTTKPAQTPVNNEERPKVVDCITKLKEEEKKDKKKSPLLPWTKALIKWKRLSVKRDTPSSSSNSHQNHHQTANASTNTIPYENYNSLITTKSVSAELTPLLNTNKISPTLSSPSSIYLHSPTSSSSILIGNQYKSNKYLSNINQQDLSSFNVTLRSDINQDATEKKFYVEYPSISLLDSSRFCRFIFPDSTSAVILAYNCSDTIQKAINRLFAKRGLTWYRTELYSTDQQPINIQEPLSTLCGKEIYVENRILIRIDLPRKTLCVRCNPKHTLLQILQPILEKLNYSIGQFVFYNTNSSLPLNLNEIIGCYDNQRILTLTKTASGVDMSSRQGVKTPIDIFEMISENDEDIKFDECGILQVVTQSKSTAIDDSFSFPIPESSPTVSEKDQIPDGSKQ